MYTLIIALYLSSNQMIYDSSLNKFKTEIHCRIVGEKIINQHLEKTKNYYAISDDNEFKKRIGFYECVKM